MPSTHLNLREDDVVRLALEFLHNRDLHITQLSLERETGVINGNFADDVLFLRQLILDGQWDDVLEFIQPLSALKAFEADKFNYAILRHKYIELLCIRSEIKAYNNVENIVDEVVKVLSDLEKLAPSKEEYSNLCLLLTLPSITDHAQFKKWNPSNARVQCFREIYPLVEQFLPCDKKLSGTVSKCAKNDRLMQLLIKGILYESCVNYCQAKATGSETQSNEVNFSRLLDGSGFDESDLSLLSWLQSIPAETFSVPFEQRMLNVDVEKLERPSLHTSWTEHMLVTPIKPRTFPHLAMPFRRPRSAADAMTRSLRPLPDGAPRHPAVMALSAIDYGPSTSCFAGFHLTGIKGSKIMNTSVDRLFDNKNSESIFNGLSESLKPINEKLKPIGEFSSSNKTNEASSIGASNATTPEHRGQDYSASTSISTTAASNSSLAERPPQQAEAAALPGPDGDFRRELLKEYQIQKQRECDDYLRNLHSADLRQQKTMEPVGIAEAPSGFPSAVKYPLQPSVDKMRQDQTQYIRRNDMNEISEIGEPSNAQTRNGSHQSAPLSAPSDISGAEVNGSRPTFKPVTVLEDLQAVRCAEFHPNGKLYAVGSNTKTLRICTYPKIEEIKDYNNPSAPTVLLKRTKHHKGSIYCLAWSPAGDLLATGSNDKTVKLMRFNSHTCNLEGQEVELTMHDGTVRDVCFIEDTSNKTSLLVSGGAGDCKIYVTDCATGNTFQALSGHSGHVLSLYNWGGAMFVSGSQDKSVRFWDLRTGSCANIISPPAGHSNKSSAVASLAVDPSGRLLVCGHDDGSCALYDVRGSRSLQRFAPHSGDVRSVRFSPGAYCLLTAGYDGRVVLTDLQGDLTCALPSVPVARHPDKVISARWHPDDFSFLSTSADKTAVLWTIPPV